ncbi:MAG: hypothetical protein JNL32_09310 [Candidatus Kapabacteria bacterium]|nr:hypothetical protein [Candidatus Kapabacteria bacterium]
MDVYSKDSTCTLSVPDYMSSTTMLNDAATLQVMALLRQEFAIVIVEDKQTILDEYSGFKDNMGDSATPAQLYREIQLTLMRERARFVSEPVVTPTVIDGRNADIVEVHCEVQDKGKTTNIGYVMGFVEGGTTLNMIMAWVEESSFKEKKPLLEKIVRSFTETGAK